MRRVALAAACLAACGGKHAATGTEAGPAGTEAGPIDAPAVDAPPFIACTPTSGTTISVRQIGTVNGVATLATSPPNDGRLFVLEQDGAIRIFDHEQLQAAPFLDLSEQTPTCNTLSGQAACQARPDCIVQTTAAGAYNSCEALVVSGGEQGLLGLAFDPSYATNRQFYVDFTSRNPIAGGDAFADVVVRYTASATDPTVADPTSAKLILSIPDFATNHNAGMIEFGPDGYLYISTGDGGSAGDPRRNAQTTNPTTNACKSAKCQPLLGKMLRIDVEHPTATAPYSIPPDNPFAHSTTGDLPEIYMTGLRNPWRWSFDRANGDMWIADVGQTVTEELDYVPAGQQNGKNFGWSAYEGSTCCQMQTDLCRQTPPQQPCDTTGKTFPQVEYDHSTGWDAIIGGQVYRGRCYPDIVGTYFYTDHGHRHLAEATVANGVVTAVELVPVLQQAPASLHEDAAGELYMTTVDGGVFHLEAGP